MTAILGKKIGMTQVYDDDGVVHPVTVVQAGPCTVLQIKTVEIDGYSSVQLGFGDVKYSRASKPAIGHASKVDSKPKKFVREFRVDETDKTEPGSEVTVDAFDDVPFVDVIGTSKGKGYAGVMKRHNFGGQQASHGTERKHRSPGSIGGHANNAGGTGGIKKGKKMSGRMGNEQVTSRNHKIVSIDKENGLLLIKGAIPGPNGGFLMVRRSKTAKVKGAQK